jgi:hypothetical protein
MHLKPEKYTTMKTRAEKTRIAGYIMAACGFILIVITALNYILGWKWGVPPGVFGIVFLGVGMAWVRRSREIKNDN